MQTIFIVFLHYGEYEDSVSKPIRAFDDQEVARAAETMLVAWEKENREPECDPGNNDAEHFAFVTARLKASEGFYAAVGFKHENMPNQSDESFGLSIAEVPFGMAQAE